MKTSMKMNEEKAKNRNAWEKMWKEEKCINEKDYIIENKKVSGQLGITYEVWKKLYTKRGKTISKMESEIGTLRQENARLMAKITGLEADKMEMEQKHEAEKMELKQELNAKIDKLHKTMADFSFKIDKLNAEIVELENIS
ncbi:hypothetical protein C1645_817895 [Glomus cerebriforme]|uniref:Uncharacterized protein n=1 Tax=Glomus cerebriforme TaxID=658196 RepID=A0A397T8G5_9GLOM|nr:hypothetical protein C1645_817895 [Glomus cerebriforme]